MAEDDLQITGAEQLAKLSLHLKELGERGLRRELLSGIRRAARPLIAAARGAALAELPKSGGLNGFVAGGKISVSIRSGGRNPGVRIRAGRGGSANRGHLRHPVFGNREEWVEQQVPPGWFSAPIAHGAGLVRREMVDVLQETARRLARV